MLPPAVESGVASAARLPSVRRIILFGSRARGDARSRSDVDLAVEAPAAGRREWLEVVEALEDADTLLSVTVVRLDEVSDSLRRRILVEGRVLYERSEGAPEPA